MLRHNTDKGHTGKPFTTALPGPAFVSTPAGKTRVLPAEVINGGGPQHPDLVAEPCPCLRRASALLCRSGYAKAMQAGAHAPASPPAGGLGDDIGMKKEEISPPIRNMTK